MRLQPVGLQDPPGIAMPKKDQAHRCPKTVHSKGKSGSPAYTSIGLLHCSASLPRYFSTVTVSVAGFCGGSISSAEAVT